VNKEQRRTEGDNYMKKHSKKIAIITLMMVFLTSFSFVGVFAEENIPEGSVTTAEAKGTLAAPVVKTYSSYNSVYLEWSPVAGAKGYTAYYNDVEVPGTPTKNAEGNYQIKVSGLTPVGVNAKTNFYTFKVRAYSDTDEEGTVSVPVKDSPVRPIGYKVKIKTSGTLKNHGKVSGYTGKRAKTKKVKAGQWLYADRFGAGGKYIFNYKGSVFYCDRLRTSTRKTIIYKNKSELLSDKEAELFVNDRGLSSKKTGVLVWVNTYTQHIYMFTGTKGAWKCVLNQPCSTGKASSPTPTGINGKKKIWKKIKTRHGIKWWSPFQEINSIHAKKKSWKIGKPSSNGCVRNYVENAKSVYKTAKIGSTVYVY
jgi:hypothetical protein